MIPKFIAAGLRGRRPSIFGDGEQSRDFTYVDNVVDANLLAMQGGHGVGEVFNVACGERVTLNQMLALLGDELGAQIEAEYRPPRPGDVRHSHADIARARTTLGYDPAVLFAEGLRRTLEHAMSQPESGTLSTR